MIHRIHNVTYVNVFQNVIQVQVKQVTIATDC